VITRNWKAGDKVDLVLPLKVQRVKANDKIQSTRNKVALRYGPLVYNIEKADQDITDKTLSSDSPLTTEWRGDLLGGVMVIKGKFSDGSPMMAVPNYARTNREPERVAPLSGTAPAPNVAGARPAPRPATSVVWIQEG
jgi:DUF1680 family protein